MHKSATSRRGRAIIASALLAGALAIGAVASSSSAQADTSDTEAGSIKIGVDAGPMSMRSGIRW